MLDISVQERGSYNIVRLTGELTAVDAPRVTQTVGEWTVGHRARLAVDLSELRMMDSAGLSELIHLVTRSRLTEGRVVLVAPSAFVKGILSVTRLDGWFEILPTLAEAEQELSAV